MILKQSTVWTRIFYMVQSSDHNTPLTGATCTVTLSKAGAAFAAAAGTVSEISNGFYKVALTTVDTNTVGDLAFKITATSGDQRAFIDEVRTYLFSDLTITSGNVPVPSNVKKNQALTGFQFVMTSSSTHAPLAGLTVTAQRSLSGGGFATCTNFASEVSNGLYAINLSTTDMNGDTVMLRFSAAGADDLFIELITQP